MKSIILSLVFVSTSAFASNPGVICNPKPNVQIVIEPAKHQVSTLTSGELTSVDEIYGTPNVELLERDPPIWETTFDLGGSDKIVVHFAPNAVTGSGAKYSNNQKVDEYSCYQSEDIALQLTRDFLDSDFFR